MRYFLILLILTCYACKKEEVLIPGNQAPADPTIEDITITNYINKNYINLFGREPLTSERNTAYTLLRGANMSDSSRKQFLLNLFADQEYFYHLFDQTRLELLNNLDTADIGDDIRDYQDYLQDSSYQQYWAAYQDELDRVTALYNIPRDLINGSIGIAEIHRRCVNNDYYEDINMGTENIVVSMFQNFLNRYPTISELEAAKEMYDGEPAVFFLQAGTGKNDFFNIFFSSNNYYEGLVQNLYIKLLYRNPTSSEMSAATLKFQASNNYLEMQIDILTSDEYAGI